jgi:hypothetical protein
MKLFRWLPAVLLFMASAARAQFNTNWNVLSNDSISHITVSNFASVNEARSIIDEIISVMNLKVNFEVREANVPNAGAVFYNGKRYILYNPVFIKQIDRAARTDWASISILAHEIGHHVKGHTFRSGGNSYEQELEADEFSGLVLKRMGATLEESQRAINMIASDRASATHPAKAYRLDAIAKGWNAGTPVGNDVASGRNEKNTTTTASSVSETNTSVISTSERNVTRESAIADRYILVDVNFSIDKNNDYFITVQNNVVRWDGNSLVVVGKLAKMKNEEYPFYIYDATKNYILISKNGYLIDPRGTKVGYLSMHTAAATAAR